MSITIIGLLGLLRIKISLAHSIHRCFKLLSNRGCLLQIVALNYLDISNYKFNFSKKILAFNNSKFYLFTKIIEFL